MPGNLVHFEVLVDDPGTLTLRTAAGDVIPSRIVTVGSTRVFGPDAPIAPNTEVLLEYSLDCYGPEPLPAPLSFGFVVGEEYTLELRQPTPFVYEYGVTYPSVVNNEAAFVRVSWDSPDVTGSAGHLLTYTATIDGVPIGVKQTGWPQLVEVASHCLPAYDEIQQDSCGGIYSVPPGSHQVEIRTHVLGSESGPEPMLLEVETRCPGSGDTSPDGSFDAAFYPPGEVEDGEGQSPDENMDAAFYPPTGNVAEPTPGPAACSVSAGARSSAAHPSVAMLLLGLLGWYSRRRK